MLHNRYQYPGGEDRSTEADIALLRQFGHQVSLLERHNDDIHEFSALEKLQLFWQTAWNPQAYQTVRSHLKEKLPDLLHVQNFFPLWSPSVHAAARSLDIPTIQHLHNFRLGCLNGYLLRGNQVCEVCVGHNPWRGVVYRCYRESLPASLSVWHLLTLNRWRHTWQTQVDGFIVPSQFAADKLIQIGINPDRLYVKPAVVQDPGLSDLPIPDSPRFIFIGRLSDQKGVLLLLQAWAALNQPEWQLQLIGSGPLQLKLEQFIRDRALSNVAFLGQLSTQQVIQAIQSATAVVVPSQSYETFGQTVVEAFACSRAVLASNLGALAELVQDKQTGLLIPHDQVHQWTERLAWAGQHLTEMRQMGQAARQAYLTRYTPTATYEQLMRIYEQILSG